MPAYWEKQIFSHGSFPEVGEKQKALNKKKKKKVSKNNGQVHLWRMQENTPGTRGWTRLRDRMLVVKSRKRQLRIANANSGGARKLPGPTGVWPVWQETRETRETSRHWQYPSTWVVGTNVFIFIFLAK